MLRAILKRLRPPPSDERKLRDALATVVRMDVARGLAPLFLTQPRPYRNDPRLRALIDEGLLPRFAFLQKAPHILEFYRWLLLAADHTPSSILEIGVKGGGSSALWKALFPEATVVGLDIRLQPWLRETPTADGVVYVEADQSDVARLSAIAREHGPFDIVIDDGSHVCDHQVASVRTLLPHMRPGGLYVIEDVHAALKGPHTDRNVDYGEDVWADFVATAFALLRRRQDVAAPATTGARLAVELARWTGGVVLAKSVLAIQVKDRPAGDRG